LHLLKSDIISLQLCYVSCITHVASAMN